MRLVIILNGAMNVIFRNMLLLSQVDIHLMQHVEIK